MIRKATKYDLDILVGMVKEYAKEFPNELAKSCSWFDEEYIKQLLMTMIAGRGFILMDSENRGFLAAIVVPITWAPSLLELTELAWWVKPEYRNSTIGGKLWLAYDKEATKMRDNNRIQVIKSSLTVGSPSINYEKRGYKMLEMTYIKE